MHLDIATLNLVLILFAAIQAAILLLQHRMNPGCRGLDWWALGSVAGAAGFALNLLREVDPVRTFIPVVGNLLLVSALIGFRAGILLFAGQPARGRTLLLILAGTAAFLAWFTVVRDDIQVRVTGLYCIVAAISLWNAATLLRNGDASARAPFVLTALSFAFHGGFFLFRAAFSWNMGGGYEYYAATPLQSVMFLVIILSNNLWTFGFISVVNRRLHVETNESRERFEAIFHASPDAIVLSRLDSGVIVDFNAAFAELSEVTRQELLAGKASMPEFWKDPAERRRFSVELRTRGACDNMEALFCRRDGREIVASLSARTVSLQGIPHVITIARDISTSRLAAETVRKSEALYRSILAASPDGILIVDPGGQIRMASAKAREIFGLDGDRDWTGLEFLRLLQPEDRERAADNLALLLRGTVTGPAEYRGIGPAGLSIDVECNAELIRDEAGAPGNMVIVVRDIGGRKQLEGMQQRNAEVQVVLKEIVEAALSAESLDELYAQVHHWVGKVLPAKNFYIALLAEETGEIVMPYCVDQSGTLPLRRPVGKGMVEYTLRQGKAVHVTLEQFDGLLASGAVNLRYGNIVKEWLGAPMIDAAGHTFGLIAVNLTETSQTFQPQDVEVMSIIAAQVALAIGRKHLEEELKVQAMTDGLTGILNRRYFLIRAGEELRRILRYDNAAAMLILDIDHFKRINDNYGHAAGDAALLQVSRLCRRELRDSDLLGRIGGEEFAILLLESDPAVSIQVAERLRKTIQEVPFTAGPGCEVALQVSIGLTSCLSGESVSVLMRRADQALYQAKKEGRNRVVSLFPPASP